MKKHLFAALLLMISVLLSGCTIHIGTEPTATVVIQETTQDNVANTTATKANATQKKTTKKTTTYAPITISRYTIPTYTTSTYTTVTIPTYTTATLVNLDREYEYDMALLSHEYSMTKEEIKMEYDRIIVADASNYQSLSAEKARLQSECLSKTQSMYNQLSQLERQYAEYRGMASMNSYYATLATQYQSQINNMRSNISQVENSYLKKIKEIEDNMKSIPTREEREQARDNELAELDQWYDFEVQKLKDKYGK